MIVSETVIDTGVDLSKILEGQTHIWGKMR